MKTNQPQPEDIKTDLKHDSMEFVDAAEEPELKDANDIINDEEDALTADELELLDDAPTDEQAAALNAAETDRQADEDNLPEEDWISDTEDEPATDDNGNHYRHKKQS